ncbi:MAG: diguanylate cyclase domain-containing protein [Cyanobacteriota bacterium]|jgi:diguanylate cyclase (GGDEF)-like protein
MYKLVNLTMDLVEQEIDSYLANIASDSLYQMAISVPYFRKKLIAKVLSQIPNRYAVLKEDYIQSQKKNLVTYILEEQLLIEEKIHRATPDLIHEILPSISEKESIDFGWWLNISTRIPCVTYYFGPFASREQANQKISGYCEDLKEEGAVGISVAVQEVQPQDLTVLDDLESLKENQNFFYQQLKKSQFNQQKHKLFFDQIPGNILITDLGGNIRYANHNCYHFLGLKDNELIGQKIEKYINKSERTKMGDYLRKSEGNLACMNIDNMLLSLEIPTQVPKLVTVQTQTIKNIQGNIVGWYWLLLDISYPNVKNVYQLRQINEKLYYESRHDLLTGLPNRRALFDFINDLALRNNIDQKDLFAFLFLDINQFKKVNDDFGHQVGDQVLIAIAHKLLTCVRHHDHVARLSGDEFMIVLNGIKSAEDAKNCAVRIHNSLAQPVLLEEQTIPLSTSIGIVITDTLQKKPSNLLHYADMAMYQAKENAFPYVIYDERNGESLSNLSPS